MERLRHFGILCGQHYEKLALTAALVLLAGAVLYLNKSRVDEQEKIQAIPGDFQSRRVKPVPVVDLAAVAEAQQRAEKVVPVGGAGNHNLFSPVEWRLHPALQTPDKVQSEKDVGPFAMRIVKVVPLHLLVVYGAAQTSQSPDGQVSVQGYMVYSTNETVSARSINPPRIVRAFVNPGQTNRQAVFTLRDVKGDKANPEELVGELKEFNGEQFSFGPGKPYQRVLTYEAELRYEPNPGIKYAGIRTNSPVDIEGQFYKVVDINPQRVVLSDVSNGKQYTISASAQ
ncbi:MAG: hypothetical protein RJA22_1302 [Verrucomicrobiota bacterium]|jgi:hypothetical protein